MPRGHLRCRAELLARDQDGIISRAQLHQLGVHRRDVRTQMAARRWQKPSQNTVAIFTGELADRQRWWMALLETGCPDAALDGVTALQAGGLAGYEAKTTISCPRGKAPRVLSGVDVRVTRWRRAGDHIVTGIPRLRPAAAAVHPALWAGTDRQAALLLVMPVQQRLTTATRLAGELARTDDIPAGGSRVGSSPTSRTGHRRSASSISRRSAGAMACRSRVANSSGMDAAGGCTSMCTSTNTASWWRSTVSSTCPASYAQPVSGAQ